MNQITITRAKRITETETITLDLPYYAKGSDYDFYAISGDSGNINIYFYDTLGLPAIRPASASDIPDVHTQITQDEFVSAYAKAQGLIRARFDKTTKINLIGRDLNGELLPLKSDVDAE